MTITTHTEIQAKQKLCHKMMVQDECKGSQCMAWQWARPANLQETTFIRLGFHAEEPIQPPAVGDLPKPAGEGWRLHADEPPYFSEDEDGSCWGIYWERDADPEREGYCAALPHPLALAHMLDSKLEDISSAVYGAIIEGCGK